jgi:hypothetical protein
LSQSSVQTKSQEARTSNQFTESTWKGLFRAGGILAIFCGAGSFISMLAGATLYKSGYPINAEAYLQLVSQHQTLANFLWSWWMVGDFLMILPTVAIYLALRHYSKSLALVGTLVVGFYLFYDVSVTELNSLTLVSLSQSYATATTDALRATFVSAAAYGYAALPLQTVLSFGVGSVGWLLWCFPMSRSIFGRKTAIFGALANIIGIIGAAAPVTGGAAQTSPLGIFQFLAPPLIGIWFIALGIRLYRHRSQLAFDVAETSPLHFAGLEK